MRGATVQGWLKVAGSMAMSASIAFAVVAPASVVPGADMARGLLPAQVADARWLPGALILCATLISLTVAGPRLATRAAAAPGPLAAREPVETEVTALFCDISDYTRIATELPPAQLVALLNRYYAAVVEVVTRHGGTPEKYIGDALLAVWGAPAARPHDADRAVRAALEIREVVERLNAEGHFNPPLRIHVGLNSGRAAAGTIGCAAYRQFAAIGDGTNVASRICQLAAPGEVLIAKSTLDRLRSRVATEALPPCRVKGKADLVSVFRVLGRSGAPVAPGEMTDHRRRPSPTLVADRGPRDSVTAALVPPGPFHVALGRR